MEEPLQKSLERYDVLDRIAVGGMAEVFLAKAYGAHGFEKTIAIKRILPELARDPEFAARFIAEAKVAVRLSHANVVQVFDFGRIGDALFIAMEFVDGLDLAAMLSKYRAEKRQVPLPAAFHIAIEIMRALDFAHQHNVVHRDVSPSNILISRAGEVKIADFGIAVAAAPSGAALPGPRRVMGKWRYMSPEQTRGDMLDTRSDMFSAASVMFELFTGQKLFPGDEAEDIIKNIHDMPIPKAGSIRPGLPSRLEEILAAPLSRKPIDRPMRPAVVLRSLIELSYESSIMATAMDVADAIATLIPPARKSGAGAQLDDVIRRQLGDKQEPSIVRRTAVTSNKPVGTQTLAAGSAEPGNEATSTGLFRKMDMDGVSRLEEVDPEQTSQKSISVRRDSATGDIVPGDSGINALYDERDPDRHTEVGGPPTGQVPKSAESALLGTHGIAKQARPKSRTGLLAMAALGAVALGGVGVYLMTRQPDKPAQPIVTPPPPTPPPDAVVVQKGVLEIDANPSKGSMIAVGNQPAIAAPVRVDFDGGSKVHVKIVHPGYRTFEDDYTVEAGKTTVIRQQLSTAPASLHVVTTPPGATVIVEGRTLGETPHAFDNLEPRENASITVAKQGFVAWSGKITLRAGETAELSRDLKSEQRFGTVKLQVNFTKSTVKYLNVFNAGKNLGLDHDLKGPTTFHLAVGPQRLHLENGSVTYDLDVTVVDGKDITVPIELK